MNRIVSTLRMSLLYGMTVLLACMYPMSAFAEEATPQTTEQTQTTPPPATTTEPTSTTSEPSTPTPTTPSTTSSSPTPTTATTPPAEPPKTYTYDSATGRWNTNEWVYDPSTNTYRPAPKPVVKTNHSLSSPTSPTNTIQQDVAASSALNANTTATIANALDSLSTTGDASINGNTKAGSALSGDAASTARIINNLNSTVTNRNNAEAATFVSNVMGDVQGDILLQPMLLKAMLEANITADQTATINNDTSVTNDLTLAAKSGDASVTKNTKAGNATSGDANTVVDVVNIVNSMIAANQSFIGTINIYGNLDGDILVAPNFLPQMLANNKSTATHEVNTSQVVNVNNTTDIVNNVALAAQSGQAAVEGNTKAGNATSGDADTNVVLFNLTGHEIVAKDSLLVFINVLGKWVGVIVDAPVGATAAAIGNGVDSSTKVDASLVIDAANTTQLTNNINLASQSGNATVAGNTLAGNATSGDATASANIANIANTNVNLSGWFGVLFINVFGTWNGSFGVDTLAGTRVRQAQSNANSSRSDQPLRVMSFVAKSNKPLAPTIITPTSSIDVSPTPPPAKEARTTNPASAVLSQVSDIPVQAVAAAKRAMNIPLMVGSLVLIAGSLWGLRRFLF